MKVGIYAGSFDPITVGHVDIIERATKIVDHLIVAVLVNPNKTKGLVPVEDRLELIKEAVAHLPQIEVAYFSGLLVDFAKEKEASLIIRGIRSSKDLEMELGMAQINKQLSPNLETIFLMTAPELGYISSSAVRELVAFQGDYTQFVPDCVTQYLKNGR